MGVGGGGWEVGCEGMREREEAGGVDDGREREGRREGWMMEERERGGGRGG